MNLRDMSAEAAEAACLFALERVNARKRETKMARIDDLDPERYYYVRAWDDVTREHLQRAAKGFDRASKDLGIPFSAFDVVWVKQVSVDKYKRAGSAAESDSKCSVQGWYDTRDRKIRLDVNGADLERTALHEAYHMYQHRQGRASALDPQAEAEAEAYAQKACPPRRVLTKEEEEMARLEAAYEKMYEEMEQYRDGYTFIH